MKIHELSIKELRGAIKRRDLSISEIATAILDRIDEVNGELGTFLHIDADSVIRQARELDRRRSSGDLKLGFLTGIPLAIKDNIVTREMVTTAGSRILENYMSPYDATVIKKLKQDGALLIGKTNCDEFAMGSSNENSAFAPTLNPWDKARVPGGSSGGSAASVASLQVPAALGSDTGGSIRQPAAFCGVVGLKPTYGRVSRYGLIAFASSLDQIGPLTRTVRDSAVLLQVIAGHDPQDSTSSQHPVENYVSGLTRDIGGLRVGMPAEWFGSGLDPEIQSKVEGAIQTLENLGCTIEEVHLPNSQYAIATYYIIAPAEASSNLARYDGVKYGFRSDDYTDLESMYRHTRSEGFGEEVKRRIMIGTYVLSSGYYDAYYLKASKIRTLIRRDYLEAFKSVDVIVGPTTPTLPFKIGEKTADPLEMYLTDIFTVPANLSGLPGVSLPCGFTRGGLPVGVQLLAPHFQEALLLRVAHNLEHALSLERPQLPGLSTSAGV